MTTTTFAPSLVPTPLRPLFATMLPRLMPERLLGTLAAAMQPAEAEARPSASLLRGRAVERRVSERYIDRILAMADAAARNLLITQAYHDLSVDMADVLGTPAAVNWCTMAAWASRRAGQSIRGEDLRWQQQLTTLLHRLPFAGSLRERIAETARQVGEGNREVFAEVAPAYAAYIATFGTATARDAAGLAAFCARFASGPAAAGGQDELRRSFELYHAAQFETDAKRKAEYVHAANLHVALQEQTRLQGRIAASLPSPLSPFITRELLTLSLGGAIQRRVGQDLPAEEFPEHLNTIEDPELRAFILRFDLDLDSTRGSAARRWDSLADRMRYIVDLFRLHASDARLFEEPLSAQEWAALAGVPRPRQERRADYQGEAFPPPLTQQAA